MKPRLIQDGLTERQQAAAMLRKMGYSTDACRYCATFEVAEEGGDPARCTIGLFWVEVANDGSGHCNHFGDRRQESEKYVERPGLSNR